MGRLRQVSYDIACRVHARLQEVCNRLKIDPTCPVWTMDCDEPFIIVGPFHIVCHEPACQHAHGSTFKTGCGHVNGEMGESFNSYLKDQNRESESFFVTTS